MRTPNHESHIVMAHSPEAVSRCASPLGGSPGPHRDQLRALECCNCGRTMQNPLGSADFWMMTNKVAFGCAICAWFCGVWKDGAKRSSKIWMVNAERMLSGGNWCTSWRSGPQRASRKERGPMTPQGQPLGTKDLWTCWTSGTLWTTGTLRTTRTLDSWPFHSHSCGQSYSCSRLYFCGQSHACGWSNFHGRFHTWCLPSHHLKSSGSPSSCGSHPCWTVWWPVAGFGWRGCYPDSGFPVVT